MSVVEFDYLLNPAFCGEVLRRNANYFYKKSEKYLPLSLSYLLLPLVLHKNTRDKVPDHHREYLHDWMQENPSVKVGFAYRAKMLKGYMTNALFFLKQNNAITIYEDGGLEILNYRRTPIPKDNRSEVDIINHKAEILGTMFSTAASDKNVYFLLGVKP